MPTTTAELMSTAHAEEATSDLARAFNALRVKQQPQGSLWGYYDGDQPLAYTSTRLRDIFRDLDTRFSENWCAVVVDSLKDRVNLTGFEHQNEPVQAVLEELWDLGEINLTSDDVHEAALVVGEAFLIIWPDEAGVPQAHYNDPRMCYAHYAAENPRELAWAAKWWVDDEAKRRLTLYYRDRLEYYISSKRADQVSSHKDLTEEQPPATNEYGVIPVFHFRPQRRLVKGELVNVIPLQNAVNKLLADMMVAAEYGAFPQRWVIQQMGLAPGDEPLRNAPNRIWELPAGDGEGQPTSVGQFNATDLGNYLAAIDNLSVAIGTISRTPRHYFLGEAGASLSGEALIAMEGPLNKKAQDRIDSFIPTWQRAMSFALQVMGQTVPPSEVTPLYDRPETIQPRTGAEITQMRVGAGVPLRSALRLEGLTDAEIEQIAAEQEEERAGQERSLGQALMAAQERFDRGGAATDG